MEVYELKQHGAESSYRGSAGQGQLRKCAPLRGQGQWGSPGQGQRKSRWALRWEGGAGEVSGTDGRHCRRKCGWKGLPA